MNFNDHTTYQKDQEDLLKNLSPPLLNLSLYS